MIRRSASDRVLTSVIGMNSGSGDFDVACQLGAFGDVHVACQRVPGRDGDQRMDRLLDVHLLAGVVVGPVLDSLPHQGDLVGADPDARRRDTRRVAVPSQDGRVAQLQQAHVVVHEVGEPPVVADRHRPGDPQVRSDQFDLDRRPDDRLGDGRRERSDDEFLEMLRRVAVDLPVRSLVRGPTGLRPASPSLGPSLLDHRRRACHEPPGGSCPHHPGPPQGRHSRWARSSARAATSGAI